MKRAVVLSAALSLLAGGAVTADAAPKDAPSRRTVTVAYDRQAVYFASCGNCTEVQPRAHEKYVTVEVVDEVSGSAHVDVAWSIRQGDEDTTGYFIVCGRTPKPQRFPAGRELALYPWAHPGPECQGSFSTRGKIKLTFSAHP